VELTEVVVAVIVVEVLVTVVRVEVTVVVVEDRVVLDTVLVVLVGVALVLVKVMVLEVPVAVVEEMVVNVRVVVVAEVVVVEMVVVVRVEEVLVDRVELVVMHESHSSGQSRLTLSPTIRERQSRLIKLKQGNGSRRPLHNVLYLLGRVVVVAVTASVVVGVVKVGQVPQSDGQMDFRTPLVLQWCRVMPGTKQVGLRSTFPLHNFAHESHITGQAAKSGSPRTVGRNSFASKQTAGAYASHSTRSSTPWQVPRVVVVVAVVVVEDVVMHVPQSNGHRSCSGFNAMLLVQSAAP
jgi:hypothetical protein